MAISLQNAGGRPNTNYYEFFVDYISDINLLPTTTKSGTIENNIIGIAPMGSSCYCFEDGYCYGLSSSGWKKL